MAHRVRDGETVRVGSVTATAHVTPGHTPGCTSWSFPVEDHGRRLLAVDVCSLTLLPFMHLSDPARSAGTRAGFERSFAALRGLPVDIFLGAHGNFFRLPAKRQAARRAPDPVAPFIDREGYRAYIDRAEREFREASAPR